MFHRPRLSPLLGVAVLLAPLLTPLDGPSPAAPAPLPRRAVVEVVFCIDTTGSMSALIQAAKLKIWSLCNQILNGRPIPDLKVGLVAFRDIGDDYVTKVYDLRDDLDDVYADLQTFTANGGGDTPEHVNQALYDAVHKISWSSDRQTIRIIFLVGDAPPHMDYLDDVKYPVTCQKALSAGILINAIQCGNDAECARCWKDISDKANGAFAAISQNAPQKVTTAFDKRLGEINSELARSAVVFGDARKREADAKKAQLAVALPLEVAADRAGYLAKENKVARYDLLDSIRVGRIKLETLRNEELPAEMQKMNLKERQEHLDKLSGQRIKLLREAQELDRQRSVEIGKELARNKDSFDSQVLDMLRQQCRRRVRY